MEERPEPTSMRGWPEEPAWDELLDDVFLFVLVLLSVLLVLWMLSWPVPM
jgi:hypothetical protein